MADADHQSLHAHARLGQPEVQRLIGLAREVTIDRDQVARARLCLHEMI